MLSLWGFPIIACVLAAWLTARFCDPASKFHILDHPNERSLHTNPTPRSGGIAIFVGMATGFGLLVWRLAWPAELLWLGVAMVLVAGVSYLDDRSGVAARYRLAVHIVAAGLLVWTGLVLPPSFIPDLAWTLPAWAATALSLLLIVWFINLYNFMDGMDGFAGGMAVIGFGAFAVFGWLAGNTLFFSTSLIIACAALGFLPFNFPPARIFLGDVGSSTLGLLAAALALWGARDGVFPLWLALLVFSPFVVDATVTLLRRLFTGERVWQAHRSHYYQRLVRLGWGHRKTVLWQYVLMISAAASALWVWRQPVAVHWAMLGAWITLYSAICFLVPVLERRLAREDAAG